MINSGGSNDLGVFSFDPASSIFVLLDYDGSMERTRIWFRFIELPEPAPLPIMLLNLR
jgi:hypothetical protein